MAGRWAERGAATVEMVGVAIAVALLAGALGPWLASSFGPHERPPPVVSRLAAPVTPVEGAPYVNLNHRLPPWPRYAESSGDLATLAAELWAVALHGYELSEGNTEAFASGFKRCFSADVRSLYEDPLGELSLAAVNRSERGGGGGDSGQNRGADRPSLILLEFAIEEAADISPAARRLFEDGIRQIRSGDSGGSGRTLNREAGCLAWDIGATRGLRRAREHLERRGASRAERLRG